jgi:hypothetical protein
MTIESTGDVVADEQVDGFTDGGYWWPDATVSPVRIERDCAWFFVVRHGLQ